MALALSFRAACATCAPGQGIPARGSVFFFAARPRLLPPVLGRFTHRPLLSCLMQVGDRGGLWRKRCGALIYVKKSNWDQAQALISYCACHSLRKITWCTDQLRLGYTMKRFLFIYLFYNARGKISREFLIPHRAFRSLQ